MTSTSATTQDGTITLTITIPWLDIKVQYEKTVDEQIKFIEIKGFRKGKAPRNIAEKELNKEKVYEKAITSLIPIAYQNALKQHSISPIVQPDITLKKAKENEDWIVEAVTCEKPKIDLGNYKKVITDAKGEVKKEDLWLPGKSKDEKKEESADIKRQKTLNTILEQLLKNVQIQIPSILVLSDVNKRLSSLVDDIQKLGLNLDSYCKSKNTTPQALRGQYETEAKQTYQLEFMLEQIADDLRIQITDTEIQAVLDKTTDEKEKKEMESNRYMIAHLLRRQKTLDSVLSL